MNLSAEERALKAQWDAVRREKLRETKAARPKSPKADRGRERDNGFAQYIRRQPCEARARGGCSGPIQHAHISYRVDGIPNSFGRSVKNHDRHANPLCAEHHRIQGEVIGEKPFWAWLGKDAYETAAAHYAAYQAGDDPTASKSRGGYREAMNPELKDGASS